MHKKSFAILFAVGFVVTLAVALVVSVAYADSPGCPNAAASDPGKGAVPPRGHHPDGGHGPHENGPRGDNSAHGSGEEDNQENFRRCEPEPKDPPVP